MRVASDLLNFRMPTIEALVTGFDESGPHIYVVTNAGISCQDWVGFASIGGGAGHANSQFMFAGHTRAKSLPETLMLVYSAKKRAEVAPGVGSATDMFLIEPPGSYVDVGTHVLDQLDDSYKALTESAQQAMEAAYGKIDEYIKIITTSPEPAEPSDIAADVPTLPTDIEGLPRIDES